MKQNYYTIVILDLTFIKGFSTELCPLKDCVILSTGMIDFMARLMSLSVIMS